MKGVLKRIAKNKKTRAEHLDLSNCALYWLPSELSSCTWLESLNISGNTKMTNLFEIANLTNLQKLNCSKTSLSDLSQISNLFNLQELDCSSTEVFDLSPISKLYSLRLLNLQSTDVVDLSPLSRLINLQELEFDGTNVSDLTAVANLLNLKLLDFRVTSVSDISPLSELKNLKKVFGYSSKIHDLSPILPAIKNGVSITLKQTADENEFDFQGCPLTNPPIEIIRQGSSAILKYFADKAKQGEEKLYEAKIVMVGAGESGKTTLIKKLLDPTHPVPNKDDKRTEGIHVTTYPFKGEVKGITKDLTAYLWDFGGQELYHATHQFFLTPDTLYVLLNDNRKNDTDFYYWLNIVRLRAGDNCPILTVFNAKEGSQRQIVPSDELFAAFPGVMKQPVDVDFADKDFGVFERVKGTVENHFTNLEVLGRPYPALWVQAREALGELKEERITYTRFEEVCQSKGITDEESMSVLAQTLHNLGVLLYFPDVFGLENLVILQPQWCVDAIYKALDIRSIENNHGRFNEKTLATCWKDDPRFKDNFLQLLKLMQQFDLCYPIDGKEGEYIAPQLLSLTENRLPDFPSYQAIHVRFEYSFMPAGMLTSLIARMSRHIRSPHVWRTGITLEWEEGTLAEVTEQAFSRQINIKVVGNERQRRLSDIRKVLLDIHTRFRGLKYEELVACNCADCADKPNATMFEHEELKDNADHGDDMICRNGSRKRISAKQILEGIAYTDIPRIFISYSHKNEGYKDEFRTMINPLERNGKWKVWDDRYILPGDDWNDAILRHFSEANVIVLMLTADFFKSNFIYDIEFSRAIQRHESGDALMIGVVVDDCMWEETPLRKIQVLPKDALPVVRHPHRPEVWKAVANKIKETIAAREERILRRGW